MVFKSRLVAVVDIAISMELEPEWAYVEFILAVEVETVYSSSKYYLPEKYR